MRDAVGAHLMRAPAINRCIWADVLIDG